MRITAKLQLKAKADSPVDLIKITKETVILSHSKPDQAFILAAGKGTRLKPYTDAMPKPLVKAAGKPMIDHALDQLEAAGVQHVVINLHYLADMLAEHLSNRKTPRITISREEQLLDTGGGLKNGLQFLDSAKPFYVVSGDSLWTDSGIKPALQRMAEMWDPDKMDLLLLLQPLSRMTLTPGLGDYDLAADGKAVRSLDKTGAYMWTSIRIVKPELFDNTPDTPFSFLELMDRAEQQGRLYGLVHDADWHHITTAADLDRVNDALAREKRYA